MRHGHSLSTRCCREVKNDSRPRRPRATTSTPVAESAGRTGEARAYGQVDDWFATDTGDLLLWFELNPLHNVVHIAIGLALLGASRPANARAIAGLVGGVYAVVGVIGSFAVGQEWNILSSSARTERVRRSVSLFVVVGASRTDRVRLGSASC